MADRRRAELADNVKDMCEGLAECGFGGLLESPVLRTFTELHKLNDTEQLSKLLAALEGAATRLLSAKAAPSFPELMVATQLLRDLEGPAGPPEGSDSPMEADFRSVCNNLRLALIAALLQFGRPGSAEAQEGLEMATGMMLMLHEKVAADPLVTLAVEHAMLRFLSRRKACVMLLREKTWSLAALNKQVSNLANYDPERDPNATIVHDEDDFEGSEEEDDDDEDEQKEEAVEEEEEEPAEAEDGEGDA